MIRLRSLLFENDPFDNLVAQNYSIQQWKRFWFRTRRQLYQSISNWHRDGVLSTGDYESIVKTLEDMDEFFTNISSHSNRLMGGGIGPEDFADGP